MKFFVILTWTVLVTGTLLLQGCASTALTTLDGSWTNPKFTSISAHRILIVGIDSNQVRRKIFENHLASALARKGFEAMSSLDVMPASEKITKAAFEKYFRDKGIDAVVTSRLLDVKQEEKITGPTFVYLSNAGWEEDFYADYSGAYDRYSYPARVENVDVVRIQTNLYETRIGKLVWKGISKTFNPRDANDVINSLSTAIVDALSRGGILKNK